MLMKLTPGKCHLHFYDPFVQYGAEKGHSNKMLHFHAPHATGCQLRKERLSSYKRS